MNLSLEIIDFDFDCLSRLEKESTGLFAHGETCLPPPLKMLLLSGYGRLENYVFDQVACFFLTKFNKSNNNAPISDVVRFLPKSGR